MIRKEEIIAKVQQVFMQYGVRSVTMDDLARELGHSKKTLYQFFDSKEALVKDVIGNYLLISRDMINAIVAESENAIDAYLKINRYHYRFLRDMNPSMLYDIRKYYSSSWRLFNRHKRNFMRNIIKENLLRGIREGLYRADINADIISLFYIYKVEIFADAGLQNEPGFDKSQLLPEIVKYHLHAIVTSKGEAYIQQTKSIDYEDA